MSAPVAIIGAGYAGLACAVELARAGVPVQIYERSHSLGGRARLVAKDGWRVDNGQHILLGAYTELTRLLRVVGVGPKVFERSPLLLHTPGGLHLQAARLPAPLHLAVGLLTARGLPWKDKLAMVRFLSGLKKCGFRLAGDGSVRELLHAAGQSRALCAALWEPLCLAALNTPPEEASAQVFVNVLRDSLAADASASEMLLPKVDLSELFPVPALRYLATRRGRVDTGIAIKGIQREPEGFRLEGAPRGAQFAQVVLATAPYHAAALLEPLEGVQRLTQLLHDLPQEPVTTAYFAFAEEVRLPYPMLGLPATGPGQWVFDRGQLDGQSKLLAVVISAHGPHEALEREELAFAILRQLEDVLKLRLPPVDWQQVITERRAAFACRPGLPRPGHRTPVPGLWLAGDYVESDYPATLESAVRSGVQCARAVLRSLHGGK